MMRSGFFKKNGRVIDLVVFLLYLTLLAIFMYFHEPWRDESQAWLITRDAGIGELFRAITHFEGHPPIWYLILMPFAKSGIPFEIGLKSINFIFAGSAMGILIFKAPFGRLFKYLIPFTYFFFYQYGVLSRSYSVMMLGFVLCALFYRERNLKPVRFVLALALICGTSAYGMVLAAGISLVWVFEILKQPNSFKPIRQMLSDRRVIALLVLLIFNAFLIWSIIPVPDALGSNLTQANSFVKRLTYMFMIAPGDALALNSPFYYSAWNPRIIQDLILGTIINIALIVFARMHRKLSLLVVPYIIFAIFGASVYFADHHLGIITMFIVFILWCSYEEQLPVQKFVYISGAFISAAVLAVSLYWSAASSFYEISRSYDGARESAAFLKQTGLSELNIAAAWIGGPEPNYNALEGAAEQAYFDHNIYMNFNNGADFGYLIQRVDNQGIGTKRILQAQKPDVLMGIVPLNEIYDDLTLDDFSLVKAIQFGGIYKGRAYKAFKLIFLRNDMMIDYPELKALDINDY